MAAVMTATPEGRSRVLMAGALLFALAAGVLVFVALQSRGGDSGAASTGAPVAMAPVVVAAQDIAANTKLTAGMLEVRNLPGAAQLAAAFESTDAVIGRPVRYPIEKGEQLTPAKVGLYQIDDEGDIALVLPAGKRAISVPLTEVTGVGGMLLPGNFVDVVAIFPNGIRTSAEETFTVGTSFVLLQDIEVLAIGQEAQEAVPAPAAALSEGAAAESSGVRPDDVEQQPDARSATLAVTPDQVQRIALVQETGGRLWLSLRPVGDHEIVSADEIDIGQLEELLAP